MFNLNLPDKLRNAVSDETFRVYAKSDGNIAELLIFEEIGDDMMGGGITAKQVSGFLRDNAGVPVNVRLNSPGGLVYDGMSIYNALKEHSAQVTATIEGLAFSAASIVAMGADRVVMHEASQLGIHRAWGMAIGNQKEMLATAEFLNAIDQDLTGIYAAKTGASEAQVTQWLDGTSDGTLFRSAEALEAGFADEVLPNQGRQAAARVRRELRAKGMPNAYVAALVKSMRLRAPRSSELDDFAEFNQ